MKRLTPEQDPFGAVLLDYFHGKLGEFDTVVMFMNNFGLFESEAKAKQLFRRLHGVTSDRGRIVATTKASNRAFNALVLDKDAP